MDAKTGKLPKGDEALNVEAEIGMPDANAVFKFGGVAAIKEPYDLQGQTNIKVGSVQKLASLFGSDLGSQYNQSLTMDGLLSADVDSVDYNDLKLSFGDFIASGKISAQNLKVRNPARITGDLKSASIFDLNPFLNANNKNAASNKGFIKKAIAQSKGKKTTFMPSTITLPMDMNIAFKLDMGGVKIRNQQIKGVFVDIAKSGSKAGVSFKALDMPGQGKADGTLNMSFLSTSKSSKTGQVTYSDPTVSYKIDGQVGQLETFLKAFAPDADTKAVTNLYKTAQFNLNGNVKTHTISLKDSVLKLDQMVLGLGGRYEPAGSNGRPKAIIDVTAGSVDFDRIAEAQGKKTAASGGNASAGGRLQEERKRSSEANSRVFTADGFRV